MINLLYLALLEYCWESQSNYDDNDDNNIFHLQSAGEFSKLFFVKSLQESHEVISLNPTFIYIEIVRQSKWLVEGLLTGNQ